MVNQRRPFPNFFWGGQAVHGLKLWKMLSLWLMYMYISTYLPSLRSVTFWELRNFLNGGLNPGFGTTKSVPFTWIEVFLQQINETNTNIMWTFFLDLILCPLKGSVPWIEVSQKKGSTVTNQQNLRQYLLLQNFTNKFCADVFPVHRCTSIKPFQSKVLS